MRLSPSFGFLLLAGVMAACSAPPTPPPRPTAVVSPVATPVAPAPRQAMRAELAAGRPQAALLLLQRELKGGAQESTFAAEYPLILTAVLAAADEHRQAQRLGAAGELLRQALEVWPKSAAIAARLPRTSQTVTAQMEQYADRLMELGLMEYRAGRLERAIVFWQQTLAIDASHPGARRALDTASLQLKNLQSLE